MQLPVPFTFPEAAYTTSLTSLISTLAASSPSTGCGSTFPSNLTIGGASTNLPLYSPLSSPNTTLQHRQYRINIPSSYPQANDEPRPLLLVYHGQYQPAWSIENYTLFSNASFNPNAIAVYPVGIDLQFQGEVLAPPSNYINDLQFTSDLLDHLESTFCIDTNRIYATGLSNGGLFTGLIACNETVGSRFAAVSGVGSAFYTDGSLTEPLFGEGCKGGAKVPYLEIHGTNDTVVPYEGGNANVSGHPDAAFYPTPEYMQKLADLNGCSNSSVGYGGLTGLETNSTQSLNGGNVTKYSWSCGGREDVVVHYKVEGLGHGWPSTFGVNEILESYRGGPTNWNASAVMGDWFGRWTRGNGEIKATADSLKELL